MICLNNYGFVRVGSAVPEMKVGDCGYNTEKILELMEKAVEQRVYVTVFPELCVTGYSCGISSVSQYCFAQRGIS